MKIRLRDDDQEEEEEARDEEVPEDVEQEQEMFIVEESDPQHGKTKDAKDACCQRKTRGIVDCAACIRAAATTVGTKLPHPLRSQLQNLLSDLVEAGAAGLPRKLVIVSSSGRQSKCRFLYYFTYAYGCVQERLKTRLTESQALEVVHCLTQPNVPLAFWTGYQASFLVSGHFAEHWTVKISLPDVPIRKIFPRRWIDVNGHVISEIWRTGLRAITGTVLLHPGISQVSPINVFHVCL